MKRRRVANPSDESPNQMALNFDVFTIETPAGAVAVKGENVFDAGIRRSMAVMLDAAQKRGLSRERVADGVTELLGRPISKAQIDIWVAPSQADRRIPADAYMAAMAVCQDFSPLEWQAAHFERKVLTADEALCAEFGAMAVIDRHIRAKQRAIEGQMDEKLFGQLMNKMKRGAGQ